MMASSLRGLIGASILAFTRTCVAAPDPQTIDLHWHMALSNNVWVTYVSTPQDSYLSMGYTYIPTVTGAAIGLSNGMLVASDGSYPSPSTYSDSMVLFLPRFDVFPTHDEPLYGTFKLSLDGLIFAESPHGDAWGWLEYFFTIDDGPTNYFGERLSKRVLLDEGDLRSGYLELETEPFFISHFERLTIDHLWLFVAAGDGGSAIVFGSNATISLSLNVQPLPVPEPSPPLLWASGLATLGLAWRVRRTC